jgi:hypothetical protein
MPETQILRATRLFYDLDDQSHLKRLTQEDVSILQAALTALITTLHVPVLPDPIVLAPLQPERAYVFQERSDRLNRLRVRVAGQPERTLPLVSIFAFDLALQGYAAYDTALIILADFFGEKLSRRAFARGQAQYCRYYLALAALLSQKLRQGSVLTSTELATFLNEQHVHLIDSST